MISDRQGFEYVELGPKKLPGSPPSYLDVYPSASGEQSYGFELLDIGSEAFIRYSRYLRINPNDSHNNRGAYLAVGFLSRRALAMHVAANCIDLVSQIFGHLKSFIGPDNSLGTNFKLREYSYGRPLKDVIESPCSPVLLLDVLMQGLNTDGPLIWKPSKPILLDPSQLTREEEVDRHLFYFDKGAPGARLRFEREREKLRSLSRKLAYAASYADQLQDEWLSYQSVIEKYLPSVASRGRELRQLIEEVERVTEAVDYIEAPTGALHPTFAPTGGPASAAVHPYGSAPQRLRTVGQRRRLLGGQRPDRPYRRGFRWSFRRVALGIGGAIALGAIFALALRFLSAPPQPAETETSAGLVDESRQGEVPEQGKSEETTTTEGSRSGVAQERAALGEPPPE